VIDVLALMLISALFVVGATALLLITLESHRQKLHRAGERHCPSCICARKDNVEAER
jgi:hypothetical protein